MAEKKKFDGFALELDVSRKISHQLSRLEDDEQRRRIAEFVNGAIRRKQTGAAKKMAPDSPLVREVDGQTNMLDGLPSE